MTWTVLQTRKFSRVYKKLHHNIRLEVDKAVLAVIKDPSVGVKKRGDLSELWVYKFHANSQLYLLGYTLDEQPRLVYLESVGSHENFYKELKR